MITFTTARKRSLAVLVAALAAVAVVAALTSASALAQGRTIAASFCLPGTPSTPSQHLFCLSAALNGQTPVEGYGVSVSDSLRCNTPQTPPDPANGPQNCVPSGTGLMTLRPGTYWITVDDPLNGHNFELRSCPGSETACTPGQGAEQELTPVCNDDPANPDAFNCGTGVSTAANPIVRTVKIELKPGTYRLFCDATKPVVHETAGMYIDFEVGGVGQVG